MTKKVNADPNAETAKPDGQQNDPRTARKVTPSTGPAAETTASGDASDGPIVTMKGVSGKVITGVVRVVKASKKDKDAAGKAKTADQPAGAARAAASKDDAADQQTAQLQAEPTAVPAEQPAPAVQTEPRIGKVGNIFDRRRQSAAAEQQPAREPAAPSESAPAAPAAAAPKPAAPAVPRKVSAGGEPAADAALPDEKRSETAGTPAQAPAADAGKPAAPARTAEAVEAPTRESVPARKAGTPGKVGNIFDQKNGSAAKSSLAATAELYAQRMASRGSRRPQGGQPGERADARRPGGRGPAGAGAPQGSGNRYTSRPARSMGGGFGGFPDKDKDDDQPKFQSKPRKAQKRTAEPAMDPFATGRSTSRRAAAGAGRHDANRRDVDRDGEKHRKARGRMSDRDDYLENRRVRGGRSSRDQRPVPVQRAVLTHVSLPAQITVKEFAEAIKKTTAEVIKALMKFGMMATINQVLDYDTASIVAGEFEITTDQLVEVTEEDILFDDSDDAADQLKTRPPVVVVMGHVDHGKTSLLDYYRKSSVVSGEAGGITQHIGAYMVKLNDRPITFLDTPGHEAFTTMRARGAMVTDIAILVVAADDGVMPQTVEAINHAKAAETQVIVAINKIDKEGANIDRVKQELSKYELIPEEWGGSTVMVPVSAKTGAGMDELLEMVLLTADVLDLKANPDRQAKGTVIEAKLDKNRGPVATLLVQRGTLKAGSTIVTGSIVGNIRAMSDASGRQIKSAGPSVPVEIMGLPAVPEAGEIFYSVDDEKMAKQLAEKRRVKQREDEMKQSSRISLDTLFSKMAEGEVKDLNLIVKADVQGSVEAVTQSLERLKNDAVNVRVIHGAVGAVTETDLRLAEVSNAIVIGFNVRPAANVEEMARESGVDMRLYRVIYNAIEDIEAAMKGMLDPEFEEVNLGTIELRDIFKISSVGTVGGGYVTSGKVTRSARVRVVRDGVVVAEDEVNSLRRFKDDVREVAQGYECGITLERFHDLKEGDVIEAFEMREIERQ